MAEIMNRNSPAAIRIFLWRMVFPWFESGMKDFLKYGLCAALLATALFTSGCGIKPKDLDPPSAVEAEKMGTKKPENPFPRTYPAPVQR
ncbi:MAG: hypothetical protein DI626_00720 [Micavibrio aeruginosavorus]|uniref:Lipoprotein n=1 Tax=Micavibrio aeruginosavorus TaxID=349221 RepID=A0A2W5C0Q1_9BACT|nr:MAG: hypothetical protein DI626_00720 [Micavibrio aeruginosavorus]